MSLTSYRQVLALPGVLRLLSFAVLARVPRAASSVVVTLYVVLGEGRGYGAAGLVGAAYTVGAAVGGPWRGRAVDRVGLRRALLPSVLVEAASWALVPFVGFHALFVVVFVGGVMAVPIFSVVRQSLAILVPLEKQHTVYALDSIGTELSFMAGPVVAVLLVTQWSVAGTVYAVGGAMALAGIGLMVVNPPTRSPAASTEADANRTDQKPADDPLVAPVAAAEPVELHPDRALLHSPALLAVLAIAAATVAVLAGTDVSIVAFAQSHGRADLAWLVFLTWPLASLVGGVIYGGVRRTVSPYLLLLGLGLMTIPAGFAPSTGWLAVTLIPAGLLCAPTMSANIASISRLVPESRRGEAMGWLGSAMTLGIAAGTPTAGSAIDLIAPWAGFVTLGAIGVGVALTGLVLIGCRTDRPGSVESGAPSGVSPTRRLTVSTDRARTEPDRTTTI